MKTYQIEMKRTSYVNMTIEADNDEEAEALAWLRVQQDYYRDDGNWEMESIEEDNIDIDLDGGMSAVNEQGETA
jgi:hypothetical protein